MACGYPVRALDTRMYRKPTLINKTSEEYLHNQQFLDSMQETLNQLKGKRMAIKAKVICDSVNENGNRLTTFEVEYPRIIHSEVMTHRMLSRNAASSRAIPFDKMLQQLEGIPSRFGAANMGMQDTGLEHNGVYALEHNNGIDKLTGRQIWRHAQYDAEKYSRWLKEAGFHKQVYNRLTEPFQMIKVVISATEWDNFFWLRDDEAADPTLQELAKKMRVVMGASVPQLLYDGDYHLPYVTTRQMWEPPNDYFGMDDPHYLGQSFYEFDEGSSVITLEQAIKVSCARCAAVSYRNEDYGLEKCEELYERLVGADRVHASALEHVATPMQETHTDYLYGEIDEVDSVNDLCCRSTWEEGISHVDRGGNLWSGNFCGFIQYRKTIVGENYVKEV